MYKELNNLLREHGITQKEIAEKLNISSLGTVSLKLNGKSIITLDEAKEMVFGCEINNSLEVTYTFAGVFDENISEHIQM